MNDKERTFWGGNVCPRWTRCHQSYEEQKELQSQRPKMGKNLENLKSRKKAMNLQYHELEGNVLRWGLIVRRGHISSKDSGSHFKICSAFGVSTEPACGTKVNIFSDTDIVGIRNLLFKCSSLESVSWVVHLAFRSSPCWFSHCLPDLWGLLPDVWPNSYFDPHYWFRPGVYITLE